MQFAPLALMAVSTVLGAVGQRKQAKDEQRANEFQAAQFDQNAGQARASAQREAVEQRRQARLANSTLRARAGGGGADPTIVRLSQDIAGEGELRALTAMYEGEERARGMETAATGKRMGGAAAAQAGNIGAFSTVLGGVGSMYSNGLFDKYGKGGAKAQV
jgi:hypothetical protein